MSKQQHRLFFISLIALYQSSHNSCLEYRSHDFKTTKIRSANTTWNDINSYISNLKYNKDEILSYKGESHRGVKKEGHLDSSNNFIVIAREHKDISNGLTDIGVLSSNEHRTYPGSLLLANSNLFDNAPDTVSVQRASLTYTVNLPGLTEDGSFSIVPTFANYQSALNNVLKIWYDKYEKDHVVNTIFQSDHSLVHSKEQLRVKFSTAFKDTNVESNIDFENVDKRKKMIMIHRFKQIFYTVSVEPPKKPGDLFDDTAVTVDLLASKMNDQNPPLLVDSVSYGRIIYVKIETTSTEPEAKALLEKKFIDLENFSIPEVDYNKELKDLNIQIYIMGGDSEQVQLVDARSMKEVNDIIVRYSRFGRTNIGYPVSYASIFVKDNSRAVVKSTTEYTETTRTEYDKGVINIIHHGWYIAQWTIEWDEISYDENGDKVVNRVGWDRNGQDLTAPFTAEIQLGGNCENISVFVREATGLIWEKWRTVIDRRGIPLINERTFKISGITLNPTYSIEPPL